MGIRGVTRRIVPSAGAGGRTRILASNIWAVTGLLDSSRRLLALQLRLSKSARRLVRVGVNPSPMLRYAYRKSTRTLTTPGDYIVARRSFAYPAQTTVRPARGSI